MLFIREDVDRLILQRSGSQRRAALFTKDLRGGGAEKSVATLANSLAEFSDLDVDLVLTSATGVLLETISKRVRIVDLKSPTMLACLPGLIRYLERSRPEVILSALDHANSAAILCRSWVAKDTRAVISVHNNLLNEYSLTFSLKKKLELLLAKRLYRKADAIIAVSQGVANDLCNFAPIDCDHVKVIANPVVTDKLIEESKEKIDHPWFADLSIPVVLNVARLTAQKNQAMLLKAFAGLKGKIKARLLIAGEGEERANLRRIASQLELKEGLDGDYDMPGYIANPYPYMAKASVLALTSDYEGLPTVLIEALACGCQVVSTDCPSGANEILQNGKWGRLSPVGDHSEFTEQLLSALYNPIKITRDAYQPYIATNLISAYREILLAT